MRLHHKRNRHNNNNNNYNAQHQNQSEQGGKEAKKVNASNQSQVLELTRASIYIYLYACDYRMCCWCHKHDREHAGFVATCSAH